MTSVVAGGTGGFVSRRGGRPFFLCVNARSMRIPHVPRPHFTNGDKLNAHNSIVLRLS